jgi:hypothetical protein
MGGGQPAPARPRCTQACGAHSGRRDRRVTGSLTGGPYSIVEGVAAESQTLMHGQHSTVRPAVELDSKKKFQIRLKSNGSNGFKFLHTLTVSNRTFPGSKNLK